MVWIARRAISSEPSSFTVTSTSMSAGVSSSSAPQCPTAALLTTTSTGPSAGFRRQRRTPRPTGRRRRRAGGRSTCHQRPRRATRCSPARRPVAHRWPPATQGRRTSSRSPPRCPSHARDDRHTCGCPLVLARRAHSARPCCFLDVVDLCGAACTVPGSHIACDPSAAQPRWKHRKVTIKAPERHTMKGDRT